MLGGLGVGDIGKCWSGALRESWGGIGLRTEGRVGFLLKFLVYLTAFVIGRMIAIAEYATDIIRFFLP